MGNVNKDIRIGTAGWAIPKTSRPIFSNLGSVLEKYAKHFNGVEINSSFYRSHKRETYEDWAAQVPEDFRFCVKLARTVTHERRMKNADNLIYDFCEQVSGLGSKLGCVLVQLPPFLAFEKSGVVQTLTLLRQNSRCDVVCEPRHRSWFSHDADTTLMQCNVSRVVADPQLFKEISEAVAHIAPAYYRLHGSPEIYYSDYNVDALKNYATSIRNESLTRTVWCIFDNTASGHAIAHEDTLKQLLDAWVDGKLFHRGIESTLVQ